MPALWRLRLGVSPIDDVRLPMRLHETMQLLPFAYESSGNMAYVKDITRSESIQSIRFAEMCAISDGSATGIYRTPSAHKRKK